MSPTVHSRLGWLLSDVDLGLVSIQRDVAISRCDIHGSWDVSAYLWSSAKTHLRKSVLLMVRFRHITERLILLGFWRMLKVISSIKRVKGNGFLVHTHTRLCWFLLLWKRLNRGQRLKWFSVDLNHSCFQSRLCSFYVILVLLMPLSALTRVHLLKVKFGLLSFIDWSFIRTLLSANRCPLNFFLWCFIQIMPLIYSRVETLNPLQPVLIASKPELIIYYLFIKNLEVLFKPHFLKFLFTIYIFLDFFWERVYYSSSSPAIKQAKYQISCLNPLHDMFSW